MKSAMVDTGGGLPAPARGPRDGRPWAFGRIRRSRGARRAPRINESTNLRLQRPNQNPIRRIKDRLLFFALFCPVVCDEERDDEYEAPHGMSPVQRPRRREDPGTGVPGLSDRSVDLAAHATPHDSTSQRINESTITITSTSTTGHATAKRYTPIPRVIADWSTLEPRRAGARRICARMRRDRCKSLRCNQLTPLGASRTTASHGWPALDLNWPETDPNRTSTGAQPDQNGRLLAGH